MKKDPAKQDSPPAAGRASDILPFRRSALRSALSYGNEVSYTIKNGIAETAMPFFVKNSIPQALLFEGIARRTSSSALRS